jgi:hypothetical protein
MGLLTFTYIIENESKTSEVVPLYEMEAFGGEEVQLLIVHDLGTRWGEWSASRPGRALYSRGKELWYPRAGLDAEARGKIRCVNMNSSIHTSATCFDTLGRVRATYTTCSYIYHLL